MSATRGGSESSEAATATARGGPFALLIENADYRRFYLGQGVSLVGSWLQAAAVSWLVFELTGSERWLGIVEASSLLPGLIVGLWAGVVADRVNPRLLILAMQAAEMACALALTVLVATDRITIAGLIACLAMTRVFVTFELPARQVFLQSLVGRDGLLQAIALNSGLFNASRVLGPAIAGVCLGRFGRTSPFLLNAVSFLAAIATVLVIRTDPSSRLRRRGDSGLSAMLGGLRYLRQDRLVRSLLELMAFFGVVGMGYVALIPAYASKVVGTGATGFSLLAATGGVGATLGALAVAWIGRRVRRERLVLGGIATFAVAVGAAAVAPVAARGAWGTPTALAVAAGCLLVAGFGAITFFAATQTMIQTAVPDHLRGRVMGVWMIVYSGAVPLGSLWAGELANRSGVTTVMGLSAALCLAAVVGVAWSRALAAGPEPTASGPPPAPGLDPPLR